MTDQDLDQMARALGLDGRLDAARHFCASMVSDMEDLSQANKRLVAARDESRRLACLFWHWALWLNDEMNAAFCACSMEELEELRVGDGGKYEEWRTVRESGKPDWLKEKS